MAHTVLVTYSSRTGVTKEIAEAIGEALGGAGLETSVSEATSVKHVAGYDLIVVGSPIYGGALREDVLTFFEAHELDLMNKRVAVFTVGMLPSHDMAGAKGEHEGAVELACIRAPGMKPVSHAIFAGAYDPDKVDFVSRKLMDRKNAPTGDYRDWDAVRAWATGLQERLAA